MTTRESRSLLALLFLTLACSFSVPAFAQAEETLPQGWLGAWQEKESVYLNIEPNRIVEHNGQELVVRGIIRRDRNLLILRNQGLKEEWAVAQTGEILRIADEDGTVRSFQRLGEVPAEVRLEPLDFPLHHSLSPEQIRAIQDEIKARFEREQKILEDSARSKEFGPVREENRIFLRQLLSEVGWIDRDRFGPQASLQTMVIAKHTEDLQLMMSILPFAEEDFRRAGKGRMYAILFDAVQLELGCKQRYGTQVQEDAKGQPFVLPLEDPQRVDYYLSRIGLPPLVEYRTTISTALFEGKTVQVSQEEISR